MRGKSRDDEHPGGRLNSSRENVPRDHAAVMASHLTGHSYGQRDCLLARQTPVVSAHRPLVASIAMIALAACSAHSSTNRHPATTLTSAAATTPAAPTSAQPPSLAVRPHTGLHDQQLNAGQTSDRG